jgi:hypothetical protein
MVSPNQTDRNKRSHLVLSRPLSSFGNKGVEVDALGHVRWDGRTVNKHEMRPKLVKEHEMRWELSNKCRIRWSLVNKDEMEIFSVSAWNFTLESIPP